MMILSHREKRRVQVQECHKCATLVWSALCCLGIVSLGNIGCTNKKGGIYAPTPVHLLEAKTQERGSTHTGHEFAYAASGLDVLQFQVSQSGQLVPLVPKAALAGQEIKQIVTDPQGRYLYVAYFHARQFSQYNIKRDGTLESPATSVNALSGEETDMVSSPDGKFLYVATNQGTIDQFDIAWGKSVQLHASYSLLNPGAQITLAVGRQGHFLYYGNNGSLNQMHIRRDGALKPLFPSYADVGNYYSIVPSADGKFVYALTNTASSGVETVREYAVNFNGTLHLLTHRYLSLGATLLVPHPKKPYLYAAGFYSKKSIQPLKILPSGKLYQFSSVSYVSGTRFPSLQHASVSFSIDPTGCFAWSTQNDFTESPSPATQLHQYKVNSNGTLTVKGIYSFKGKVFSSLVAVWH